MRTLFRLIMEKSVVAVDKLQDELDKLVLTVFEAMRGVSSKSDPEQESLNIIKAYDSTVESIENLIGINNSAAEQTSLLAELSQEFTETRDRISCIEKEIFALQHEIDLKLEKVTNLRFTF